MLRAIKCFLGFHKIESGPACGSQNLIDFIWCEECGRCIVNVEVMNFYKRKPTTPATEGEGEK